MLLLNIIIFIVTLIFYVHIYNHLYVNNKLDIQYIPCYYKQAVDDLVDLKTPFYFKTNEIQLPKSLLLFKNNGMKDLIKQNANKQNIYCNREINIISKNYKDFEEMNNYLKPYTKYNSYYDFIASKTKGETPLQYSIYCRNFFYISEGSINITLIPPKYSKFLSIKKNYDILTYQSNINVWKPTKNDEINLKNCKKITTTLKSGHILYIPPYWNYSFQVNEKQTSVCCFSYETVFNRLATLPHYIFQYIKTQNINLPFSL